MIQPDLQGNAATGGFAERTPSQSWEQIAYPDAASSFLWVWFKPSAAPHSLVLRVPDETWQNHPSPAQLTMRRLLQLTGVEPNCVAAWHIHGAAYDGMNGANPLLDQPLPAPPPGVDPNIAVYVNAPQFAPAGQDAPVSAGNRAEVFQRIDADWNAILEMENEVKALRKDLFDTMNRLKTLNRDLNTDERVHADNQDTKDWLDARRALRDAGLRLSVCVKELDMGDVSSAGQRAWFEQIFQQFVVPRQDFDNMHEAEVHFSYHRKMVANLQNSFRSALLNARNNGERPAERILNRIAAKIRDAQTKRNFLGAMLD